MDLETAGLHKHAFRLRGKPLTFVRYESQERALEFLRDVCSGAHGLGVLQGTSLSGKTSIVQQFIEELPTTTAIARIDCKTIDARGFLPSLLAQFGCELDEPTINEQMNFLRFFHVQNSPTASAPLLFVDNAHDMDTSMLHCLCQLINARFHDQVVIRIVLISYRSLGELIRSTMGEEQPAVNEHLLGPMTIAETEDYVNFKLCAAGCDDPELIVPWHLADEIYEESQGYPGLVDLLVLRRLQDASELPLRPIDATRRPAQRSSLVAVGAPTATGGAVRIPNNEPILIITRNGKVEQKARLNRVKTAIGRSELNDITVDSSSISRYHAMFIRHEGSTVLVDLNSRNGVFVNSKRIVSKAIQHDDLISIGYHRIKVACPGIRHQQNADQAALDTTGSMRALRLRRKTKTTGMHTV